MARANKRYGQVEVMCSVTIKPDQVKNDYELHRLPLCHPNLEILNFVAFLLFDFCYVEREVTCRPCCSFWFAVSSFEVQNSFHWKMNCLCRKIYFLNPFTHVSCFYQPFHSFVKYFTRSVTMQLSCNCWMLATFSYNSIVILLHSLEPLVRSFRCFEAQDLSN